MKSCTSLSCASSWTKASIKSKSSSLSFSLFMSFAPSSLTLYTKRRLFPSYYIDCNKQLSSFTSPTILFIATVVALGESLVVTGNFRLAILICISITFFKAVVGDNLQESTNVLSSLPVIFHDMDFLFSVETLKQMFKPLVSKLCAKIFPKFP